MSSPNHAKPYVGIAEIAQGAATVSDRVSVAEGELIKRIDTAREGQRATYVFKIGLEKDDFDWIALQLGQFLQPRIGNREKWDDAINASRRMLICTLALAATHADAETAFWRDFWRKIGVPRDAAFETHIRHNLERLLRTSNLNDFADRDLGRFRYVALSTLHAGFQSSNLLPLCKTIERLSVEHGATTGTPALGNAIAEHYRMDSDAPVGLTLFSTHIPGAAEIFDRIVEFTEYARTTPDWYDRTDFEGTNGIPAVLFDELRTVLMPSTADRGRTVIRKGAGRRPRLRFDFDTALIRLSLPGVLAEDVSPDANFVWIVDVGNGEKEVIPSRTHYGDFLATDVSVPAPIEHIHVEAAGTGRRWTVPVRAGSWPLILFRPSGEALRNQHSIGAARVLAAAPTGTSFVLQSSAGDFSDVDAPALELPGWEDWSLHELELADARAFEAHFPDGRTATRQIARDAEARFETQGPAIEGLFAESGEEVLSQSPLLTVPEGGGWSVAIDYVDTGDGGEDAIGEESLLPVDDFDITDEDERTAVEIFDPSFDDPWVGVYQVTLRRGGLIKYQRRFAIAEGLSAADHYDGDHGDFLIPMPKNGRHETTKMQFRLENLGNKELRFPDGHIGVDGSAPKAVTVESPLGYSLHAVYRPKSLRFTVDMVDGVRQWNRRLTRFDLDDADERGHLTVVFPVRVHNVCVQLINSVTQVPVADLNLSKVGKGSTSWTCAVSRIIDRFGDAPSLLLTLSWEPFTMEEQYRRTYPNPRKSDWYQFEADYEPKTAVTRLFTIDRQPFVTAASVEPTADGDRIVIVPGRRVRGDDTEILAWAWPLAAPYRAVPLVPSFNAESQTYRAPMPQELSMTGPLLVDVREGGFLADDTMPERPTAAAVVARQDGLWSDSEDPESRIARFLLETEGAVLTPSDAPTFWRAVDKLGTVLSLPAHDTDRVVANVREVINAEIGADARQSLVEMGKSPVDVDQQLGLFIGSGLVTSSFRADETFNEYHRVDWIGLLEEMTDLIQLRRLAPSSQARRTEQANSLSYIRETGGEALHSALANGTDRLTRECAIDNDDLAILDSAGEAGIRRKYSELLDSSEGRVPPIDPYGRFRAQAELMLARSQIGQNADNLKFLYRMAEKHDRRVVTRTGNEDVVRTVATLHQNARDGIGDDRLWLTAPYISYVLSLLSRLEAHGLIPPIHDFGKILPEWRVLAWHLPTLTRFDVLMAEAIVLNAAYGDLTAPTTSDGGSETQ